MWQIVPIVISVLSPFIAAGLAAVAFTWQLRRNLRLQVYLDATSALYEAERLIALRIKGHLDKQSLSAEEHKEISKAYMSLLGRIGKLHLVVDPKTMNDVNVLYDALWNIYDGFVPVAAGSEHIVTKMGTTDIDAQVDRFYQARGPVLTFMRKDLGYKVRSLKIVHNDFVHSFLSDYSKEG
ncbi:MAG: hypothetical protein ACREBD_13490 [Blastocatellia bacterium]